MKTSEKTDRKNQNWRVKPAQPEKKTEKKRNLKKKTKEDPLPSLTGRPSPTPLCVDRQIAPAMSGE
jgi:hypothetical protein